MKEVRLPDSELKVMVYIWDSGKATAKQTAEYMLNTYDWKKNTTYTVLNNLITKGFLKREEPEFLCIPLVSRDYIVKNETQSFIEKFYKGSSVALFSSFLSDKQLSPKELDEIKLLIEKADRSHRHVK